MNLAAQQIEETFQEHRIEKLKDEYKLKIVDAFAKIHILIEDLIDADTPQKKLLIQQDIQHHKAQIEIIIGQAKVDTNQLLIDLASTTAKILAKTLITAI